MNLMNNSRATVQWWANLFLASLLPLLIAAPAIARKTAAYSAKLNTSALQPGQTAVAAVVFDVLPGYHAQSHQPLDAYLIKFEVSPDANPAIEFLDPIYPPGEIVNSPALGKQSVYTGEITIYLPFRVKSAAALGDATISGKLTWQACNDQVCFQPEMNQPFAISTKIVSADTPVTPTDPAVFTGFDPRVFSKGAPPLSTAPASTSTAVDFFGLTFSLGASNIWLALAVALAVGVLFNLMPCVLPVMPLKAIGFLRFRAIAVVAVFSWASFSASASSQSSADWQSSSSPSAQPSISVGASSSSTDGSSGPSLSFSW